MRLCSLGHFITRSRLPVLWNLLHFWQWSTEYLYFNIGHSSVSVNSIYYLISFATETILYINKYNQTFSSFMLYFTFSLWSNSNKYRVIYIRYNFSIFPNSPTQVCTYMYTRIHIHKYILYRKIHTYVLTEIYYIGAELDMW